MSDLTKSAIEVIVDAINLDNPGLNLMSADITLGSPADISGTDPQHNTQLQITAVAGRAYRGDTEIKYNRVALADIVATGSAEFTSDESLVQISDLVELFNVRFNTNLIAGVDYTDGALPAAPEPGQSAAVTLTALPVSVVYTGAIELTLKTDQIDLDAAIENKDLSGLTIS